MASDMLCVISKETNRTQTGIREFAYHLTDIVARSFHLTYVIFKQQLTATEKHDAV